MHHTEYSHRFVLGLALLGLGLSTVGIWPLKHSSSVTNKGNISQSPNALRSRPEKYVGRSMSFKNEPAVVMDVRVEGTPVEVNSAVAASEDWLNGLTFKIRNTSRKKVVFIYAELLFPEKKTVLGSPLAYDLRYGADPKLNDPPAAEQPIEPGSEAEFVVSDTTYQNLKRIFETRITPIKNINSVLINILRVVFDDDTAWAAGSFMHRDPADPKRWIDN